MNITPITTITVDENTVLNVSDCSEKVQELVTYFNDWRQREADARSEMLLAQQGLKNLTNEIITQVKADMAPAEEAAPADAPAEVAPATDSEASA